MAPTGCACGATHCAVHIQVEAAPGAFPPSQVTDAQGRHFKAVVQALQEVWRTADGQVRALWLLCRVAARCHGVGVCTGQTHQAGRYVRTPVISASEQHTVPRATGTTVRHSPNCPSSLPSLLTHTPALATLPPRPGPPNPLRPPPRPPPAPTGHGPHMHTCHPIPPPPQAVPVLPSLVIGATDSRHYESLTQHGTLRVGLFAVNKTAGDLSMVHGTDERVAVEDYVRAVCTYKRIVQLLAA